MACEAAYSSSDEESSAGVQHKGAHEPFDANVWVKQASMEARRGFVRKVYGILTAQLLLTVLVAAPLQTMDVQWLRANSWLLYLSVFVTVATICAMVCCEPLVRQFPTNYIFLFIFTFFEGIMIGFASATFTWQSVVLAAGITVAVFAMLTLYACCTSNDFTGLGPYLFGALNTLLMFGLAISLLSFFGVRVKWLTIVYDCIGVLIFVCYIVFDTQLILGELGGHKKQFGLDDYVFAALNLYLDIINLFLHILSLLGERK